MHIYHSVETYISHPQQWYHRQLNWISAKFLPQTPLIDPQSIETYSPRHPRRSNVPQMAPAHPVDSSAWELRRESEKKLKVLTWPQNSLDPDFTEHPAWKDCNPWRPHLVRQYSKDLLPTLALHTTGPQGHTPDVMCLLHSGTSMDHTFPGISHRSSIRMVPSYQS